MKILFLTPSASRGGSEMMLYYLCKNVDREQFETALYADRRGALIDDFSAVMPTYYSNSSHTISYRVKNKIHQSVFKQSMDESLVKNIHQKFQPDFWYFNTMTMTKYVELAIRLKVPYVVHFHELISVYDDVDGVEFEEMVNHADLLIGCSDAVCEQLARLGHKNIAKFNEIVDLKNIRPDEAKREILRKSFNIEPDDFVWLMSGATSHRKGFDFLPEIMQQLDAGNTHMVWLGRRRNTGYVKSVMQDVKQRFEGNIHFIDERSDDYYDYLNIADGFVLTSREDPFPLVMIEAAYLGKPIVGYRSGGIEEFLKEGMGGIVNAYNHQEIAALMRKVMSGELSVYKDTLKRRAEEFDADVQYSNWEQILLDYFQGKLKSKANPSRTAVAG